MSDITIDDAISAIIETVVSGHGGQYSNYGYELYLPNVIAGYLVRHHGANPQEAYRDSHVRPFSSVFMDAAWTLCRYGILRPGITKIGVQATDEGSSGAGYTVTSYGRKWLDENADNVVVLRPGRLSSLFTSLSGKFGPGFLQRAQEAVACHTTGAHLASCAMSGAATESIFLAAAIAKTGDEEEVLKLYRAANGRKKLQDLLVGQLRESIAGPIRSASSLISYWRDEAAHGVRSTISEIEAHDALARLLRLAQFVNEHWDELTGSASSD